MNRNSLNGNLAIQLELDALSIPAGSQFSLFAWEQPVSPRTRFAQVITPTGTGWDLSQLYTTGTVTFLGNSSDFDADHDVDAADLRQIVSNWTGSGVATDRTWMHGDSDGDGDVDSLDILELLSRWTGAHMDRLHTEPTSFSSAATFTVVPEPGQPVLANWFAAGLVCQLLALRHRS